MPPVPGPVFSKAFNALLVLLVIGCVFLGMNLRDAVMKMQASDIGTNNEVRAHAHSPTAIFIKLPYVPTSTLSKMNIVCLCVCVFVSQVLTARSPGNAQWLASIQKTKGMRSGHHSAGGPSADAVKPKKKGGKKGRVADADDDDEAEELETFVQQPKASKKKKGKR